MNACVHLRKLLAGAELYGKATVARALDDELELHTINAERISNVLAVRQRIAL